MLLQQCNCSNVIASILLEEALHVKKVIACTLSLLILCETLPKAQTVDFFATVSSSNDSNMIKMTTDLFYSQFLSVDGYTVNDRRAETFDPTSATRNIAFYAQIEEDPEGGWICTLNAIEADGQRNVSSTKKYDTYYKILLDAKRSLENLLENLSGQIEMPRAASQKQEMQASNLAAGELLETIAGAWAPSESELIEKALILRGGRGFVIFKNGASMNVSVSITPSDAGSAITIKQIGKPNASYFPELPREKALQNASDAPPIEWRMMLYGQTLQGTKKTLLADESSPSGVRQGEVEISWVKR